MKRRTLLIAIFLLACKREPPAPPRTAPSNPAAQTPARPATPTNPGQAPPPSAVDPPAPASAFRETAQYLPQGSPTEGWTQSGDVRSFAGQNLFQAIDGAGEKYMPYGFRQMVRTDYRKAGTQLAVTIEIYDMGSTLGAFGMYSMLLSDGRDPASMRPNAVAQGGGGFLGTGQLVFWKGQHLVQMNLADESGDSDENALRGLARETLPAMAARVASSLPGETTQPAAPQGFPSDGLVWGGATYLADDVFGIDQSGPAWVGHYQTQDGKRYRLAVFSRPSADAARALAGRFRPGAAITVTGAGEEAFSAGAFAVARKGSTVIVVTPPTGEGPDALPQEGRVERLRVVAATLS